MPLSPFASLLLYVPFDKENSAELHLKNKMTEEEFFEHCFIKPEFDKKIQYIKEMSSTDIDENEIFLTKEEIIKNLNKGKSQMEMFDKWRNDNSSSPYCIMGDAGTGKTSYLNFLKFSNRDQNWQIIDLQSANREVTIYDKILKVDKKENLHYMVFSAIIMEIVKSLFLDYAANERDILKNMYYLKRKAFNIIKKERTLRTTTEFFHLIKTTHISSKKTVCQIADSIHSFLHYLINNKSEREIFGAILDIYLLILLINCKNSHTFIVFDNIERYIKTTEIYSNDIIEFMKDLRTITDRNRNNTTHNNIDNFSEKFKFIVAMRKTTVRMFTSLQTAEYLPHIIDISDWFPINEIINKKMKWLNANRFFSNIDEELKERLQYILNDVGFEGEKARGLQQKLDLLFNYDKRIISEILVSTLTNPLNDDYLKRFDDYRIHTPFPKDLNRFAIRSIITRLLFNELSNQDEFTQFISKNNFDISRERLNYVRKILTVLLEQYKQHPEERYMPVDSLIIKVTNISPSNLNQFYNEDYYKSTRETLSGVLYFMNYYNRRNNHWLQLIDTQYNAKQRPNTNIKESKDYFDLLMKYHKNMNIGITYTGKAYLDYVVQTFEFFSCCYGDFPPLLCTLPNLNDFLNCSDVEELYCTKIVKEVSQKAIKYMRLILSNDDKYLIYTYNNRPKNFMERIVNHHCGYMDNFLNCLKYSVKDIENEGELKEIKNKIQNLEDVFQQIKNQYYSILKLQRGV